jgi:hypothetical protein
MLKLPLDLKHFVIRMKEPYTVYFSFNDYVRRQSTPKLNIQNSEIIHKESQIELKKLSFKTVYADSHPI